MKEHQQRIINELRNDGYLVCIWIPEELGNCDVELGNEVIDNLKGTP